MYNMLFDFMSKYGNGRVIVEIILRNSVLKLYKKNLEEGDMVTKQ